MATRFLCLLGGWKHWKEDAKLIAAEASYNAQISYDFFDPIGDLNNNSVPCEVAECIIDSFEVIDVDNDDGREVIVTPLLWQRPFKQFKEEPPIQRTQNEPPLNVKVLVNFAPQNSLSAALQPLDTSALVSILRSISRDPRIGKFSITEPDSGWLRV